MNLAGVGMTIESSYINTMYDKSNITLPESSIIPFFGRPRERIQYLRNINSNTNIVNTNVAVGKSTAGAKAQASEQHQMMRIFRNQLRKR